MRYFFAIVLSLFMSCALAQDVAGPMGSSTGFTGRFPLAGGMGGGGPPFVPGSNYNFVANTATVNGVAQPSSVSSITDTRATIGYDLAASTQFAINTPKRTSAGLLIEPSFSNGIIQSQAFNNSSWTKTNVTAADNNATAPDGTTTATLLTTTSSSSEEVRSAVALSFSSNVGYVVTCFFKIGTAGNWVFFGASDDASNSFAVYFNTSTGAVGSTSLAGTGHVDVVSFVSVGNGWYRAEITGHFTSGISAFPEIRIVAANGSITPISGQNTLAWGMTYQATTKIFSYFPTTTAAATYAFDSSILTTASNAATAVVTYSDTTTQTLAVPVNNQLLLINSAANFGVGLAETLLTSINIPAPVTSYTGSISTTTIGYNPTIPAPYASCKYTAAPFTAGSVSWKVLIPSWYLDYTLGSYQETNLGASYTVKMSVESPPGTFTPITFSGVSTGSTVTPGTDLLSDAITVPISSGATPNLWFFLVTDGTHGIPSDMFGANQTASICNSSATPNDQTTTGGTVTSNMGGFGPLAIIGSTTKPTMLVIGDSRTRFPAGGQGGEVPRQLDLANISYIETGTPGDRAQYYIATPTHRNSLHVYTSHVEISDGINDLLGGGVTSAVLQGRIGTIMGYFPGQPTILTTLAPSTTSTDSWATVANQTSNIPSTGALNTQNTWLLTVPYPAIATWDIASQVGQIFGGVWVWNAPGYTVDGLHETATGITAIGNSGVVNISNMRL